MMRRTAHTHRQRWISQRGFTLIEMLMVIALISLLVGLLIVALGHVRRTGELASTEKLMRSIDMGLAQFKEDHGFLPPLLDDTIADGAGTDLLPYPVDRSKNIDYYSVLTLAPYLIGVGDLNGDGQVDQYDDGVEGAGFRDPGVDQAWGYTFNGATGRGRKPYWKSREKMIGTPPTQQIPGKVYGPYIQVSGDQEIGYAKNRAGIELRDPDLFAIKDYWGGSIRYYRNWPKVVPQDKRLEDYLFACFGSLKPDEVEGFRTQARSAEYIIMSTGPDTKAKDRPLQIDPVENKDNIVRAQS